MDVAAMKKGLRIKKAVSRGGGEGFVCEDPSTGNIFALGAEERFILDMLLSGSGASEIAEAFKGRFGKAIETAHVDDFARVLADKGILGGEGTNAGVLSRVFQSDMGRWRKWRLFNPERQLVALSRALGWCYTPAFRAALAASVALSAGIIFFNSGEYLRGVRGLVETLPVLKMLAVMYLFINLPAEVARGATGARYRAYSSEFGIWLAYNIMPKFYCLSRIWEIGSESGRRSVLLAPSVYTAMAGSAGVILWRLAPPSSALQGFGLLLSVLAIFDLFIRLNPLWPTEGYFLLSNHFGILDFRRRAVRAWAAWALMRPPTEPQARGERALFVSYGFLTWAATLAGFAAIAWFGGKWLIEEFGGTGGIIILALFGLKFGYVMSDLFRSKGKEKMASSGGAANRKKTRKRIIFWSAAAIVVALFPYPYNAGGPFKLLPLERIELHTQVPGEVVEVYVREDSLVRKGDQQALIDNREHRKNLEVMKAELEKETAELKLLEKGPKPEEVAKAREQAESARLQSEYSVKEEKRLKALFKEGVIPEEEYEAAENRARVDSSNYEVAKANLELVRSGARPEELEAQRAVIRDLEEKVGFYSRNLELTRLAAPIDGRIVTPYVETMVGKVLKEGDLFAAYENSKEIQAEISVPEADIGEIGIGSTVRIRPYAYSTRIYTGTVALIAPKADETSDGKVVRVVTNIPNPDHELKPGMTGEAKIDGNWKPVIVAFTRPVVRFVMVEVWSWIP